MTVRELIDMLQELPNKDAEVHAYDAEEEDFVPVKGALYTDKGDVVELSTYDDDAGDDEDGDGES